MLGAAVLIGVIVWMARAAGRRSAADAWRSKVIDAYAKGSASPELQRIRGPYPMAPGVAAYPKDVRLHQRRGTRFMRQTSPYAMSAADQN